MSCDSFLSEDVYDFYTPDNMYQTEADAIVAINGVYAPLVSSALFGSDFFQLIDLDQDHGCAEGWVINAGFADGNWQNVNNKFKNTWEQLYLIIERANVVIDKVPAISMNETQQNQIIGEAYFMRAFSYFYLVRLWGQVPIRETRFSESRFEYHAPRASISTIYEKIINDLIKAEELMLYKNSDIKTPVGRANKASAQALLTKVYLTIGSASSTGTSIFVKCAQQSDATKYQTDVVGNSIIEISPQKLNGYENFDSKKHFELAREKASELIELEGTPNGYILKPKFIDVFKYLQTDSDESLFTLGTSALSSSTMVDYQQYFGYKSDQDAASGYGRGYMFIGNSFYNSYLEEAYGKNTTNPADRDNRDARIVDGIKRIYTRLDSQGKDKQWFYPQSEKDLYPELGAIPIGDGSGYASDNDTGCTTKYDFSIGSSEKRYTDATISFIRYADVILMYAEALNETVGPTAADKFGKSAIDYVNRVRARSNATPIQPTMECYDGAYPLLSSAEGLRSFILEERGREFFYEMNRVFDLKRWGIYLDVMNEVNSIRTMSKRRQEKHLLFPLPIEEIRANTALSANDNNGW